MRTGFDAKRALNNSTGLGNHARILINALMRDFPEHEYLLFTPKGKNEFLNQLSGEFKMIFPETKFQKAFHPLWRSFGIKQQLTQNRIDVYHGLSNEIPFGVRTSGVKLVVTIHDLIFLKHPEQYPFVDRQVYKLKTQYAAKHADKIIAVSRETKNDLMEIYRVAEEKIEVIYPSVDKAFQIPDTTHRTDSSAKYILNVGSFVSRKNQKTLIEAYALIENKIEEELWLVGSGIMKEEIQKLVTEKKLNDRVKIISGISNEDLPGLYRSAKVFVFPSLFEGFGAPVSEALLSKVPVIATKGGAIEEAAGKNSLFINPNSAEDISAKILDVLNRETLRTKMIEEGYAHALTITDNVFAGKTMRVYQELAG